MFRTHMSPVEHRLFWFDVYMSSISRSIFEIFNRFKYIFEDTSSLTEYEPRFI